MKIFPKVSNNNFSNNNLVHRYIILSNNLTANSIQKCKQLWNQNFSGTIQNIMNNNNSIIKSNMSDTLSSASDVIENM